MTTINDWLNKPGNDPTGNLRNALNGYNLTLDLGDLALTSQVVIDDLRAANPAPCGAAITRLIAAATKRERARKQGMF